MDRIHSAPAAVSMARSVSTRSVNNTTDRMDRRSISTIPALSEQWEEPMSGYTLYSKSSDAQPSSLETIEQVPSFAVDEIHMYSPADYISTFTEYPSSSSLPSPANAELSRLSVPQLTSQWHTSFDSPTSPSTPTSAGLATPPTVMSSDMSRQSSVNTQFMGDISMLRVNSNSTPNVSVLSEDCFPSLSSVHLKNISLSSDNSNFLNPSSFTGSPSESFFPALNVSPSATALSSFQHQSDLVEDMQRSTSIVSSSSSSSASSNDLRHVRREREIMAQSSRRIAPKANRDHAEARAKPSNAQMVRVRSQDGSSKDVGLITKAPYVRPVHAKVLCPQCNENPDGFRGEHELRRHYERAHAAVKKVWVCVDASPDKKFLANCKHCRNGKQYGAYYNAAAHLRRAHFHPRKRGRKGKHDEKRGGIGGGDKPPMEELKQLWMKELDVPNVSPKHNVATGDFDDRNCADNVVENFNCNTSAFDGQYPHQSTDSFEASTYDPPNQVYFNGFAANANFGNFEFDAALAEYDMHISS
jgi:hypothetical protein